MHSCNSLHVGAVEFAVSVPSTISNITHITQIAADWKGEKLADNQWELLHYCVGHGDVALWTLESHKKPQAYKLGV